MANQNSPFGLRPTESATGAPSNFEMRQASIAYNNATIIYDGDPVKLLSTGYIAQWTAGTAVSQLWGIFKGCEYLSSSQGKKVFSRIWPGADVASTAQNSIVANIIPCNQSTNGTFIIQSDSTGAAFADIGQTCDVALGTGNTYTQLSGCYLDMTTQGTTATLPFRIVGIAGGSPGQGGFGVIQPSTTNPYGGSALGASNVAVPYNWVVVTANNSGSTGI